MTFTTTILTPEKTLFEGEITSVSAPGTAGYFEVLANHAPMIATLDAGKLTIVQKDGKRQIFSISGGVFENHQNKALILVTEHKE